MFSLGGLGLLALLATPVRAILETEAGVIDWHKSHIGVPLFTSTSTAPTFHKAGTGSDEELVLTTTASNVLAALHPSNGSIAWRHVFEAGDRVVHFHRHERAVATLSGPGGSMLRSFDALTGELLVENRLHTGEGHLTEGTDVAFVREDVLALTGGHTLTLVDGASGEQKWFWVSPDQGSSVMNSKVISTADTIYLVGLTKSFASLTLHLTSFTPSGKVINAQNILSSIDDASDLTAIRTLSHTRVIWRETDNAIHSVLLTPNLDEKPVAMKGSEYGQILNVGLTEVGRIVAKELNGAARVLSLDSSGSLKVDWDFPRSADSEEHAGSKYSGGIGLDGKAYIARVFWSMLTSSITVDVYDGENDMLPRYTLPFDTDNNGIVNHVALSPSRGKIGGENVQTMRVFLTTSSGDLQLWEADRLRWTREESLSATVLAEIIDVPEERLAHAVDTNEESFVGRLTRQFFDAQNFPRYLVSLFTRFTSPPNVQAVKGTTTAYHVPGSRKVVVAATQFGTLFGLDARSGEVLWKRVFGPGWASEIGGSVRPVKLFVLDGKVLLVTQRRADNSLVDTVIFHVHPLTGISVNDGSETGTILEGVDVISGPLIEAYILDTILPPVVVLVDEFLQANIYPDSGKHVETFENKLDEFRVPLLTSIKPTGDLSKDDPMKGSNSAQHARLTGHQFVKDTQLSPKAVLYPTWTFTPPLGEHVNRVVRASKGKAAQVGTVVGNRKTWYRYLNPRVFGVITSIDTEENVGCGIYLVDGGKGTVLYRVRVPRGVDGGCEGVQMSLAGNWLVYTYFDHGMEEGETKGQKVISVEMYEGALNVKSSSSDSSGYSNSSISIQTSERAFFFDERIVAMAHTETAYGITVRDVIVATHGGSIRSLGRKWLNARRPFKVTEKNATVREEDGGEEELQEYEPMLPTDPRLTLSHKYVIPEVRRIVSAPARLESTSLVFAYGLDFFFTRTAPSGTFDVLSASFNKAQLVLTISGLAVAIAVVKPIVDRRKLRERWYN